jgi:cytochrome b561
MRRQRYTRVAIALHWAIAALILCNLGVGFFMENLESDWKDVIVPLHISCGLTVLALTALRIAWRVTHAPPPLPEAIAAWEKAAARAAHALMYLLLVAMPVTGWSIISAHPPRPGAGPRFFGLTAIAPLAPISHLAEAPQKAAHATFVELHSIGGWIFLMVLILHVSAALKHQFLDGHRELQRMGLGKILR